MSNHPILEAYDLYVRYHTTFTNPGPLFEVIDKVPPSSHTMIDGKTVREPSDAWRISGASYRRPKGSSSELVMLWIRQLNEVSNAKRSVCISPDYDGNRVSKIIVSKVDPSDIEEFEDLRTFLFPLSFDMMTGELVEKKFYHQDLIAALKDQKNHVLLVGPPGEGMHTSTHVDIQTALPKLLANHGMLFWAPANHITKPLMEGIQLLRARRQLIQ